MKKLLTDFFSENGNGSSKRLIAITISIILGWSIIYGVTKAVAASERYNIITATMIFVLIMSGVATVAQIMSIVKGTPPPKDEEEKTKP